MAALSTAIIIGAAVSAGAAGTSAAIQSRSNSRAAREQREAATTAAEIEAGSGREERDYLERQAAEDKLRYEQDRQDAERRYETDRRANYDLAAVDYLQDEATRQGSYDVSSTLYGQSEARRRGDYDQGAARDTRLGSLSQMFGFGDRAPTPAYVPGPTMPAFHSGAGMPGYVGSGGSYDGSQLDEARQKFEGFFPGETLTPQMVRDKQGELEAAGFTLRPNAQGVVGKISYGNGPIVDIIQGADSGLNRRQWLLPQGGYSSPGAPVTAAPTPAAPPPTLRDIMAAQTKADALYGGSAPPPSSATAPRYAVPSQRRGYTLRDMGGY